jgi:stringent starvation protein B
MIPTTPYLIRAIYDWCSDQGFTPHLLVDASIEGVVVPRQLVKNDTIVLNIQASAVRSLELGNEWVMFNARFSGKAMDISVPVNAVRAIFARENGLGCAFEAAAAKIPKDVEQVSKDLNDTMQEDAQQDGTDKTKIKPKIKQASNKKSHLKLV